MAPDRVRPLIAFVLVSMLCAAIVTVNMAGHPRRVVTQTEAHTRIDGGPVVLFGDTLAERPDAVVLGPLARAVAARVPERPPTRVDQDRNLRTDAAAQRTRRSTPHRPSASVPRPPSSASSPSIPRPPHRGPQATPPRVPPAHAQRPPHAGPPAHHASPPRSVPGNGHGHGYGHTRDRGHQAAPWRGPDRSPHDEAHGPRSVPGHAHGNGHAKGYVQAAGNGHGQSYGHGRGHAR